MAAGDIKGIDIIVISGTLGAATTVGQVVHLEPDGKWDPVTDSDKGKFGVALDAGGDTETARILIWGPVEVTATAVEIVKGSPVMAGAAGAVCASDYGVIGENVGTAIEGIAASGVGTIWVGLVN
jgi:hypothetical protein